MQVLGYKTSDPDTRGRRRLFFALILTCFSLLCLAATMWLWVAPKAEDKSRELEERLKREEEQRQQLSFQLHDLQQRLASVEASEVTGVKTDVSGVKTDLGSTGRRSFTDPVWNVWAEKSSSTQIYRPQSVLLPNRPYSFVVNPAAFGYDTERLSHDAGVYSQTSSSSLSKWVLDHADVNLEDLDILIIPDRVYFEPQGPGEAKKSLTIDLAKIRRAQKHGFAVPTSAFATLSKMGDKAPFSFGVKSFKLHTTEKTGIASIAVSVWWGGRPIDEISFRVCVAAKLTEPCDVGHAPVSTFRGIDLGNPAEQPSAALHVIDRQSDVVGVFRCNLHSCGSQDYLTWEIPDTVDEFAREIKGIVRRLGRVSVVLQPGESKQAFKKRRDAEFLEEANTASDALYNVIFGRSSDGQKAKAALLDFVLKSKVTLDKDKSLSSLFVRLIPSVPGLVLTPVGLLRANPSPLALSAVGAKQTSEDYVGFDVDIEMPLELQDYSASSQCISSWTLFVPPDKHDDPGDFAAVESARLAFNPWIETFRASCGACVKDDETTKSFREFLSGTGPDAGAVVILSHHDDDYGLYFDENHQQPAILPSDISRTFPDSSVAILAACGTAEPGGSEFIRKFNEAGIHTVLATTTAVDSAMSGRFLALLLDAFKPSSTSKVSITLGRARFDAVRKLSAELDDADVPYGPRALVFTLAGNASRRLCVPAANIAQSAVNNR